VPVAPPPASRVRLAVILGSLTALGPMSIDMYLPALPRLTERFDATESAVQLTLTACLAGLALGQLVAGPLSDSLGRRRPLVVGLALYVAASVGCALAPTAEVLTGARLVQGLAGAAGVVIARAVARDLFSGPALARFFSMLILVNGLAPILAPVIGSQLMRVLPWQGVFLTPAGYGVLVLLGSRFGLPETLPAPARSTGGWRATRSVMGQLLVDRRFIGYAVAPGLLFAAMFSYISGSPFVLQQVYWLSPQQFGLAFGLNALGILAFGQLNGLLLRWVEPRRLLLSGLLLAVAGASGLLLAVRAGLGLPVVLAALFAVVSSVGLVMPNSTALALSWLPPERAGSASALLGVLQFAFGAVAAPLVGAAGAGSAMPMAVLMCGLTVSGLLAFGLFTPRRTARVPEPAGTGVPGVVH
jgi:DHA1 family bicyclomycin/chloramphenicol resistance-like MFS transporter